MAKNTESNPLFRLEGIYSNQNPLQDSTGRLLISLFREFENTWKKDSLSCLEDSGLSASEFNVISIIRSGSPQVSSIAKKMGVTKQAVSKSVINLKKRGLVGFSQNAKDARSKILSVTEKGERYLDQALNKAQEIEGMYSSALGPDSHAQMKSALQRLIDIHKTK